MKERLAFVKGSMLVYTLGQLDENYPYVLCLNSGFDNEENKFLRAKNFIQYKNLTYFELIPVTELSDMPPYKQFTKLEVGSTVRYQQKGYQVSGIFQNDYAQTFIPSPVLINPSDIITDVKDLLYSDKSDKEVIDILNTNWRKGKYDSQILLRFIDANNFRGKLYNVKKPPILPEKLLLNKKQIVEFSKPNEFEGIIMRDYFTPFDLDSTNRPKYSTNLFANWRSNFKFNYNFDTERGEVDVEGQNIYYRDNYDFVYNVLLSFKDTPNLDTEEPDDTREREIRNLKSDLFIGEPNHASKTYAPMFNEVKNENQVGFLFASKVVQLRNLPLFNENIPFAFYNFFSLKRSETEDDIPDRMVRTGEFEIKNPEFTLFELYSLYDKEYLSQGIPPLIAGFSVARKGLVLQNSSHSRFAKNSNRFVISKVFFQRPDNSPFIQYNLAIPKNICNFIESDSPFLNLRVNQITDGSFFDYFINENTGSGRPYIPFDTPFRKTGLKDIFVLNEGSVLGNEVFSAKQMLKPYLSTKDYEKLLDFGSIVTIRKTPYYVLRYYIYAPSDKIFDLKDSESNPIIQDLKNVYCILRDTRGDYPDTKTKLKQYIKIVSANAVFKAYKLNPLPPKSPRSVFRNTVFTETQNDSLVVSKNIIEDLLLKKRGAELKKIKTFNPKLYDSILLTAKYVDDRIQKGSKPVKTKKQIKSPTFFSGRPNLYSYNLEGIFLFFKAMSENVNFNDYYPDEEEFKKKIITYLSKRVFNTGNVTTSEVVDKFLLAENLSTKVIASAWTNFNTTALKYDNQYYQFSNKKDIQDFIVLNLYFTFLRNFIQPIFNSSLSYSFLKEKSGANSILHNMFSTVYDTEIKRTPKPIENSSDFVNRALEYKWRKINYDIEPRFPTLGFIPRDVNDSANNLSDMHQYLLFNSEEPLIQQLTNDVSSLNFPPLKIEQWRCILEEMGGANVDEPNRNTMFYNYAKTVFAIEQLFALAQNQAYYKKYMPEKLFTNNFYVFMQDFNLEVSATHLNKIFPCDSITVKLGYDVLFDYKGVSYYDPLRSIINFRQAYETSLFDRNIFKPEIQLYIKKMGKELTEFLQSKMPEKVVNNTGNLEENEWKNKKYDPTEERLFVLDSSNIDGLDEQVPYPYQSDENGNEIQVSLRDKLANDFYFKKREERVDGHKVFEGENKYKDLVVYLCSFLGKEFDYVKDFLNNVDKVEKAGFQDYESIELETENEIDILETELDDVFSSAFDDEMEDIFADAF